MIIGKAQIQSDIFLHRSSNAKFYPAILKKINQQSEAGIFMSEYMHGYWAASQSGSLIRPGHLSAIFISSAFPGRLFRPCLPLLRAGASFRLFPGSAGVEEDSPAGRLGDSDRGGHGSCYFHPETREALACWRSLNAVQAELGGNSHIDMQLYPLCRKYHHPHGGGSKGTGSANGLVDSDAWAKGIEELHSTAGQEGTFCYTFSRQWESSGIISSYRDRFICRYVGYLSS